MNEKIDALDEGILKQFYEQMGATNNRPVKKRTPANFKIQVVENGYIIFHDGGQYIYPKVDDIVDSFVDKLIQKPKTKFE